MALPVVAVIAGPDFRVASVTQALEKHDPVLLGLLQERCRLVSVAEAQAAGGAQGIVTVGHGKVDGAVLDDLRDPASGEPPRVLSVYGVGVDHVDLAACRGRGTAVGHTPGVLTDTTADLALALLLGCARVLPEADRFTRSPAYDHYQNMVCLGTDLHHSTVGVVGFGRIGTEVGRRLLGFHCHVLYHARTRKPEAEAELGPGVEYCEQLHDMLRRSDWVVLCCPGGASTRHLIDRAALAQMRPSAGLINVARGTVVDTGALVEALQIKAIACAGLDVTDPEPLPQGHPLLQLSNVVFAPHRGSATVGTRRAMAELCAANLFLGLAGQSLRTPCLL